jgi:hypothetical protein
MFVRIQLKHFIQIAANCSLVFIIFINFLTKKLSRTSTFLSKLSKAVKRNVNVKAFNDHDQS